MLSAIKNSLFNASSVCSVELLIDADGTAVLNWIVLSRKKDRIRVEKSGQGLKEIQGLVTSVSADIPLVISLSGKGVLHKKVAQQGSSQEKLFDYVFPNARISDYLVQTILCSDNSFYVSVIRKEQIDKVLKIFTEKDYHVLSVSLGAFAVLPVMKLLHTEADEFHAGRHTLQSVNHSPLQYAYDASSTESQSDIEIGGEKIASGLMVAYANAFQYLVDVPDKVEVHYEVLDASQHVFKDKQLFRKLSWGGLVFFFVILLINAFFYALVSEKNDELTASYSGLQQKSVSNKKDMEDFSQKEAFLLKSGWLNAAALSYYADRIAASLPDDIQLTALQVSPFNESMTRKSKKEIFDHDLIIVRGIADRPTEINQWTKQLNEFKWVDQVKVQDYAFDHKTAKGAFTLYINISGELE